MESYLFQYEPSIRFAAFCMVFVAMAAWDALAPRRPLAHSHRLRWPANLSIVALNTVLLRLVLPATAIGFSVVTQVSGWGLFNQLSVPSALTFVMAVVTLDFVICLQHIAFQARQSNSDRRPRRA